MVKGFALLAVRGVLLGGNWNNGTNNGRWASNWNNSATNTNNNIGARCALPAKSLRCEHLKWSESKSLRAIRARHTIHRRASPFRDESHLIKM